jgi:hypothetical protein
VKVQCELCREVVPLADFVPSVAGIEIRCPACHGTFFVPADAPPAAVPAPAAAPDATEMDCPKCGRRQPRAESCRYCGLLVARWDPAAAPAAGGDEVALRLFAEVEAGWADRQRHEAFIEHCGRAGLLSFAARCYRERQRRDPDDAMARAQLARVVAVAEATYLTRPRESGDAPLPHRGVLVGVVILIFAVLLAVLTSPLWRWWR